MTFPALEPALPLGACLSPGSADCLNFVINTYLETARANAYCCDLKGIVRNMHIPPNSYKLARKFWLLQKNKKILGSFETQS